MGKKLDGITSGAESKLLAHHWPGNVRELRNAIERAVIIETSEQIQAHNIADFKLETGLRKEPTEPAPPRIPTSGPLPELVADFERRAIEASLERNRYSLGKCAEELGLTRHALRYRMQRLNINAHDSDDGSDGDNGKEQDN